MGRMRYSRYASPQDYSISYNRFRGADFSADQTQVDASHSPMPRNLVADEGGFPEKRIGWRTVSELPGRINGIYRLSIDNEAQVLVHAGTILYRTDGEAPTVLRTELPDARSTGFLYGGRFYLLTGKAYLVYGHFDDLAAHTYAVRQVSELAYQPTTIISRDPSGGGTAFEPVNLLSPYRKNDFLANGTAKEYQLDAAPIDAVEWVEVNGVEQTVNTHYRVDLQKGTVTFVTAPPKPETVGGIQGADNVKIRYRKVVEGYAEQVNHCTIAAVFGEGSADRVFLSGNSDFQNRDWCSGFRDATYIPDTSYALIGSRETAVMGYLPIANQLAILKEDNQQDATVFLRSALSDANGEARFPVRQGVHSIGVVSKYSCASLRDDPLFLSKSGVNGLATSNITLERSVCRRSGRIDPKLTREPQLAEAVACVHRDRYLLCVDGHCYVADGKQRTGDGDGGFQYEWFYWENIPARVLVSDGDTLWFGTEDGRICRFNSDIPTMNRFSDDGKPIVAEWTTRADDDGDFMRYKTLLRRGSGILCKPYTSSSVSVGLLTETGEKQTVRETSMSILDFSDMDFENFSFHTAETPIVVPFGRRIPHYQTMQIIVRNSENHQGFGVFGIVKRFRIQGYVK